MKKTNREVFKEDEEAINRLWPTGANEKQEEAARRHRSQLCTWNDLWGQP